MPKEMVTEMVKQRRKFEISPKQQKLDHLTRVKNIVDNVICSILHVVVCVFYIHVHLDFRVSGIISCQPNCVDVYITAAIYKAI